MSSPAARRSVSRGRTRTPAAKPDVDDAPMDDAPNGAGDHSRSRTRSRSPSRARSRTHSSLRDRSYSRSATRSPTRSPSPEVPQSAKIVIEKLTKNVNEGHLREIFSTYGDIQELEMPMNKHFMMNKGIAYVLYTEARYAESAIAHMHEAQLDGALINVSIVLPRRRFSRSPPLKRPPPNRFGEPHRLRDGPPPRGPPADRAYGGRPPPQAGVEAAAEVTGIDSTTGTATGREASRQAVVHLQDGVGARAMTAEAGVRGDHHQGGEMLAHPEAADEDAVPATRAMVAEHHQSTAAGTAADDGGDLTKEDQIDVWKLGSSIRLPLCGVS